MENEPNFDQGADQPQIENPDETQNNQHSFTDEEVANLREIFDLFDKQKTGHINSADLETIMNSLQRNPAEISDHLQSVPPEISFDEFIALMQQIENRIVEGNQVALAESQEQPPVPTSIQADTKVLDFLRLLEEYRRKCEEQGNYSEAKKASAKYDDLLKKET